MIKREWRFMFEKLKKYPMNCINHLKTVCEHKKVVFIHCLKAGIPVRGILHDLSKFSPREFWYGIKYFSGTCSPNEGERSQYGYSNAWMHHKGRNRHHFEYWTDYNPETKTVKPVKMPLKFVAEMFCDRVAAGKIYKKDDYTDASPYEYFMYRKSQRFIHPETEEFLAKLLIMLKDKGEDYTFRYLRFYLLTHKDY